MGIFAICLNIKLYCQRGKEKGEELFGESENSLAMGKKREKFDKELHVAMWSMQSSLFVPDQRKLTGSAAACLTCFKFKKKILIEIASLEN